MKILLKTAALAAAAALVIPVLFSCSAGSVPEKPADTAGSGTTAAAETAAPARQIDSDLAALDYSGKTVTILSRPNGHRRTGTEIWVEELTNDPVNDAIYNRNAYVTDLLGLGGIVQAAEEETDVQRKVEQMVNSGDQTYDIVAASVYYGTPMIQEGLMYDLYGSGIDDYLHPENEWWAQYWIEEAELMGRLYCITGAPALSVTRMMFVMYYNKDLGESLQLENMYGVVNDGRWTIDYLNGLIAPLYRSLNGDDVRDETDLYGLAINHSENCDMFWSAFDMSMITRDEDGWLEFDASQGEKISSAFEKVFYLIRENPGTFDTIDQSDGHEGFEQSKRMFANGNTLFTALHLMYAETSEFRNMQDDYGILPVPKYDEKQKEYYTFSHDQYTVFMVPITVADPVMSGAVLEALAYESYFSVQPVYYDLVLRGRYANDPESRAMLDMITSNIRVDPSWIYGMQISQPEVKVFRDLIYSGSKTFGSAWERQSAAVPVILGNQRRIFDRLEQ